MPATVVKILSQIMAYQHASNSGEDIESENGLSACLGSESGLSGDHYMACTRN